jgi:sigma-B regulation protein RsbU (phosphoserine phosphatase)
MSICKPKISKNDMAEMLVDDLDTAPGGFITFSDAGLIMSLNTTLLTLLDYPDKVVLTGKSIESLLSVAGKIFYQTHFFPLLKLQGNADEIFFRLKTREGKEIPVICNAVRKVKEDGIGIIHCLFIPATQRSKYEQELLIAKKEAQASLNQNRELLLAKAELEEKAYHLDRRLTQLKQMNDDLIQFGKIISHDLQEPIRKIAVFADKVASDSKTQLDNITLEQFRKINRECIVLRQLGANLERFISLNVHSEHAISVDLQEVFQIAFKTASAGEIGVELLLTLNSFPIIIGYQRQLEMLFFNLFKNSIQSRRNEGILSITIEPVVYLQNLYQETKDRYRYSDFLRLTITDNGVGFDQDQRINYFAIGTKHTTNSFGLGFGLAFCKKVMDNHYGEIAIKSTIGQGTVVVLALPIST